MIQVYTSNVQHWSASYTCIVAVVVVAAVVVAAAGHLLDTSICCRPMLYITHSSFIRVHDTKMLLLAYMYINVYTHTSRSACIPLSAPGSRLTEILNPKSIYIYIYLCLYLYHYIHLYEPSPRLRACAPPSLEILVSDARTSLHHTWKEREREENEREGGGGSACMRSSFSLSRSLARSLSLSISLSHLRRASACMRSSSSSCETVKPSNSDPHNCATLTCST